MSFGLPGFTMVGLPDASVRESRDRVRSAIRNSGFEFPAAPHHGEPGAGRRAQGRRLVRSADRARHPRGAGRRRAPAHRRPGAARRAVARRIDSRRRAASCRLPSAARRDGLAGILLPAANAGEAAIVSGLDVFRVSSLADAVRALNDPASVRRPPGRPPPPRVDRRLRRPRGRARTTASRAARSRSPAAGGHNLLLVGPPGAGKTMMARRVPGILPPLTLRRSARGDGGPFGRRPAAARAPGCWRIGRSARRITRFRTPRSSAAARSRGRARSASRITACCFSTRCSSSAVTCSRCCASRSRKAR